MSSLKNLLQLVGIVLIVLGILGFVYQGYTYTKHETVAQLGDIRMTVDTKERVYYSPWYGVASFAAGVALVVIGRRQL